MDDKTKTQFCERTVIVRSEDKKSITKHIIVQSEDKKYRKFSERIVTVPRANHRSIGGQETHKERIIVQSEDKKFINFIKANHILAN